jgi:hypothetical protein
VYLLYKAAKEHNFENVEPGAQDVLRWQLARKLRESAHRFIYLFIYYFFRLSRIAPCFAGSLPANRGNL